MKSLFAITNLEIVASDVHHCGISHNELNHWCRGNDVIRINVSTHTPLPSKVKVMPLFVCGKAMATKTCIKKVKCPVWIKRPAALPDCLGRDGSYKVRAAAGFPKVSCRRKVPRCASHTWSCSVSWTPAADMFSGFSFV